jgi:curved DNA-binding protein CbpA
VQSALKTLGLSADDITSEKVKDAYRRLAKRYHPDAAGGDGVKMSKINKAYKIVNDWLN